MSRTSFVFATALILGTLAGCASDVKLNPTPVETRGAKAGDGAGAGAGGSGSAQTQVTPVDLANKDDVAGAGRTVYFDLDSYIVKDDYRGIVEAQAKRLTADRKKHITIEGHTDERGGSEYNLALGQRRAEAVMKSMILLGAQDSQLEAVSFGKERPAVMGSNEDAWAKNRRAELKDR